jgi:hypothetical protein
MMLKSIQTEADASVCIDLIYHVVQAVDPWLQTMSPHVILAGS